MFGDGAGDGDGAAAAVLVVDAADDGDGRAVFEREVAGAGEQAGDAGPVAGVLNADAGA